MSSPISWNLIDSVFDALDHDAGPGSSEFLLQASNPVLEVIGKPDAEAGFGFV